VTTAGDITITLDGATSEVLAAVLMTILVFRHATLCR